MKRFDAEAGPGFAAADATDDHALDDAARRVAQVAAQFADDVDRAARFPGEALDAMREHLLLGAMVPRDLGGRGASLAAVASACRIIGHACSSAAMIFAMHQIQVACIVEHALSDSWYRQFLRQLTQREWLLASATSEDQVGGNLRNSHCAIEMREGSFTLHKLAPTISYGAHADAILATARRDANAPSSEQVLVTLLKEDTTLTPRSGWDTFGMRGTCSEGFALDARGHAEQIFPALFAEIAEQTMVPTSHILWAAVWAGIAGDAFRRAHQFFRTQMQKQGSTLPPSARRLAEALALLQAIDARIEGALRLHGRGITRSWSASMAHAAELNTLKTYTSSTALEIVSHAAMICGMASYKNGTPYTLGRHIRDLHSAPLMISNDRIEANTANLLLALRPASLERDS
ncbi:acyl-CoA/acyl-ACP dehydrogenase [Burkholderia sp. FERM BP-3421]|jgi:acyl-CoA dehydrogenase|uniref:acyl-CoA dehydrogenase family protein n=1 Tax=Burkholderia sp. FERM BP-3421 TaxID=1494466 RepID=UPI00235E7E90|nr:acyl-CoA dehydrogenase family protein [Burkholderia sp. FERM BP-3421]WDD95304.1 acyl-CoA/acyl-ACP dehydrogenase [Burkholderia sp. FERM BP-3421]